MRAFDNHTGLVAPLDRANIDTDQIIPKQFLKSIRRTGFGDNLFDAWRFRDEGDMTKTANEREINRTFVLNEPRYQGASVLVTRTNFGCGSSREHAVWALLEYGFRCVIAPSFADIFAGNSLRNGLLLVTLPDDAVSDLIERAQTVPGFSLTVDLPNQTIAGGGFAASFDIEPERKRLLAEGLDEIAQTLRYSDAIHAFESGHRQRMPWVFAEPGT